MICAIPFFNIFYFEDTGYLSIVVNHYDLFALLQAKDDAYISNVLFSLFRWIDSSTDPVRVVIR
jgi:hypothetical protein